MAYRGQSKFSDDLPHIFPRLSVGTSGYSKGCRCKGCRDIAREAHRASYQRATFGQARRRGTSGVSMEVRVQQHNARHNDPAKTMAEFGISRKQFDRLTGYIDSAGTPHDVAWHGTLLNVNRHDPSLPRP